MLTHVLKNGSGRPSCTDRFPNGLMRPVALLCAVAPAIQMDKLILFSIIEEFSLLVLFMFVYIANLLSNVNMFLIVYFIVQTLRYNIF